MNLMNEHPFQSNYFTYSKIKEGVEKHNTNIDRVTNISRFQLYIKNEHEKLQRFINIM